MSAEDSSRDEDEPYMTGTADGHSFDRHTMHVWRMRDGRVDGFVARSTSRGKKWLRCLRRLSPSYMAVWWVSAHGSRKEALENKG
jgi:hypothetical protein